MSSSRVPIERVVEDVAAMGFARHQVRDTVRRLTESGEAVDLNKVLDEVGSTGHSSFAWTQLKQILAAKRILVAEYIRRGAVSLPRAQQLLKTNLSLLQVTDVHGYLANTAGVISAAVAAPAAAPAAAATGHAASDLGGHLAAAAAAPTTNGPADPVPMSVG